MSPCSVRHSFRSVGEFFPRKKRVVLKWSFPPAYRANPPLRSAERMGELRHGATSPSVGQERNCSLMGWSPGRTALLLGRRGDRWKAC